MPKLKTHSATAKRVRVTKNGKLLRRHSFANHFLQKKSSSRKRAYSGEYPITNKTKNSIRRLLGV